MKAAVFMGVGKPLEIQDLPDPAPGPGEVLLKVAFCGVCGSDLSYTEAGAFGYPEGFVAGHEIGATVVGLGEGVTSLKLGDKVAPSPNRGCGVCEDCLEGRAYFCSRMEMNMGGFGQLMLSPAIACVKLPDALPLADAALIEPLAVGLMGVEAAGLVPGQSVVVLGAGPIGLSAIYWAKRHGAAKVVAAARSRRHEARARAAGADAFFLTDDEFSSQVRSYLGSSPDVVIDAVGKPGIFDLACELVKARGTVSVLGLCQENDEVRLGVPLLKALTIKYVLGTSEREFRMVAEDLAAGHTTPRIMVTDTVTLAALPRAFEEMRNSKASCKVLVSLDEDAS